MSTKPGRHQQAVGVDLPPAGAVDAAHLGDASRRRPPRRRCGGAPVPSTTVPPRITRSCSPIALPFASGPAIVLPPIVSGSGPAPATTVACTSPTFPPPLSCSTPTRSRPTSRTMASRCPGAALRPHVKAHKCTALAAEQARHGNTHFTCATLREVGGTGGGRSRRRPARGERGRRPPGACWPGSPRTRHGRGRLGRDGRRRGRAGCARSSST